VTVTEPWIAEVGLMVTVMVVAGVVLAACVLPAAVLAALSALSITDWGIGSPASWHANCIGLSSRSGSRLLSQLPFIQITAFVRKFPADAVHRHPMSARPQLDRWTQFWIHPGSDAMS